MRHKLRLAEDCYCLVDRQGLVVKLCRKHKIQMQRTNKDKENGQSEIEFLSKQFPQEIENASD